ncbi:MULTISPECIES: c-type cytochrome [Flavobacteriaceae]|uniref:C-type cytochrome n=2 Tax=Flavobacteriaceae TaxID=49546 RepID=A0A9X2RAG5_9FLAO|nr:MULTISPECIES: c-type cytochrome [Flavobacteriaceae]MCP9200529.1 c-type cytochrome [Gramella oceanisediminis]MDT0642627.1 c-type cytochrome [Zunongwangia sp. F363]
MKDFRSLIRSITYFFSSLIALIVVLFIGIFLFDSNPSLFIKSEISSEAWQPKDVDAELASGFMPSDVKYGYQLIAESSKYMGPQAQDPGMRYAGNNLACINCHLKAGTQPGSASWVGVTERFPQFRGRSNSEGTIEDRINGCMQRSMDGEKLPTESREMKSIVAYMKWLGEDLPEEREKEFKGFPKINIPDIAVNLEKGKALFIKECAVCHGEDGQGQRLADSTKGYQYPPLWGPDSYNNGAGMHRVITAAQFIKGNMPFGQATWDNPKLSDEEAYHLAGYINSFERPQKSNLEKDYPDLKLKPVSTPYGPWADTFSSTQHKYGPFPPIMEYYQQEYGLTKNK